ncbi:MAG: hypothetical protein NVSMB2_06990 [Chloroflexota bacterium]
MDPPSPIRALLVEDNPGDARLIRETLRDLGGDAARVDLTFADRLDVALQKLGDHVFDAILLDLSLPDSQGLETFSRVHATAPEIPVLVLSGLDDEAIAMRAVHGGAQDYLVKGHVDGPTLLRALRYAIERERLERARRDLERQRDEFFSSVSHDLRTPVAAIKAAIGVVIANEPGQMPPTFGRLLVNIDQAADELSTLIDNLLEIARLQSGRVTLWRTSVDLRTVIERAVTVLEPLFGVRHQRLTQSLPEEPVFASVDGDRVGRALRNLLENAQKYGRDEGRVHVSLRPPAGVWAEILVSDDGPGIPVEDQKRIFERFYRVRDAPGYGPSGTGLGLAIARGLVELHGGTLTVESEPGHGSTFCVRLPLGAPEATSPNIVERAAGVAEHQSLR